MAIGARDLTRLGGLLERALTLSPTEREAWLAALPAEDQQFQSALRRIFDPKEELAGFLSTMPRVTPRTVDADEAHAGEMVGAYRLMRPVARGGMGSVWLAERADGALQRQVALKLPHLKGAGLAERMLRERDIGARLEHPHIARLYDAGLDHRGRPFLAFEFIDGVAIDLWCRSRQLNLRGRLKLFLQVAQAVAYAHARLVVHRDLKPSNVLVSPDGQVHLLDFGIAKLLHEGPPEDAGATQRLGAVMTPHYASPEQLRGEQVTVTSDVYSLGVLLYELLSGERPYAPRRAGMAALEEAVLQAEPQLVSQWVSDRALARALRGDLDAILAKALQRQSELRYATVDALADDVQRHLAGEPVRARPATVSYRLGKFTSRSRAGLALAASTMLAVGLAAGMSLEQAQRANEAAARASAVKDFVLDTFRVDATGEADRLDLLKRGARLIDARFDGQPALQAELHGVVSSLFDEMANFELAELHAARRLEVLTHSGATSVDKAMAAVVVSQALLKLGRPAQAEEPAAQAIGWAKGEQRLSVMARLQLAASLAAQFKAEALARELDQLDAQIAQGLAPVERPRGMQPGPVIRDRPPASIERAMVLGARAGLDALTGQGRQAIDHANQAVALATAIEGAASPRVLNLRWILWRLLMEMRQIDEARELGASIVADLRQLGGPQDSTAAFAEAYTTALLFANDPKHRLSFDAAEAIVLANREIVKRQGARGIADAGAWSDYLLGGLYVAWHDFDRAEPLLRQALTRIAPLGDELTLIPHAPRELAWVWIVRGDHARGDAVLQQQLGLATRRASPMVVRLRAGLAFSQGMQGRYDEALALLGPPPSGTAAVTDPRALDIAVVRAGLLLARGDAAKAMAALPPADALASLAGGDGGQRGEALCAAGRNAEGFAALGRYLESQSGQRSKASPFLARARAVQGLCALADGNPRQAKALAAESRWALQQQPAVSPYFKKPLERLEGALSMAASATSARR